MTGLDGHSGGDEGLDFGRVEVGSYIGAGTASR